MNNTIDTIKVLCEWVGLALNVISLFCSELWHWMYRG